MFKWITVLYSTKNAFRICILFRILFLCPRNAVSASTHLQAKERGRFSSRAQRHALSQHIHIHDQKVAETAGHHKQVEDLVHPEIGVALLKARPLQSVNDAAHGVEQPAGQQPAKAGGRQAGQQLGQREDAGPAHGDVQRRRHPLGAEHEKQHGGRPQQGAPPDDSQQHPAHQRRQRQQADRGIAAGDHDKDHHVVQLFEQRLVPAARGHRVIGGAGRVQGDDAETVHSHRKERQGPAGLGGLDEQGHAGPRRPHRADEMGDRAGRVLDIQHPAAASISCSVVHASRILSSVSI